MAGPKHNYQAEIESGVIWRDELQADVVNEFERLYLDLTEPRSNRWLFAKKAPTPKGIYIYGSEIKRILPLKNDLVNED